MKRRLIAIYNFYVDGFKNMTWGRQLWWVILLKIIILFLVLRAFFFKPVLAGKSQKQRIEHVSNELMINEK
ncbi:MAG: DUF4492 domain-containing protein [Alistipes sp.]|nr:DUF4492 domain-containing protein [Alistipes sp.]MBR6672303.1 DUF4492 domain-containing protein [Alistipes sp.]MBR7097022.1 DUF4492 domain-containing protein [Alistipes sp.]